jgi:hypothetical protein
MDPRAFSETVVSACGALGEGASGDGGHNVVVDNLDDDRCDHFVDILELVGSVRLGHETDFIKGLGLLVQQRGQDDIKVENDILHWLRCSYFFIVRNDNMRVWARIFARGHAWHDRAAAVIASLSEIQWLKEVKATVHLLFKSHRLGNSQHACACE